MQLTIDVDKHFIENLKTLSNKLHKKKSDIIREAITLYAKSIEKNKKNRLLHAVEKTKNADREVYDEMESTLNDGI